MDVATQKNSTSSWYLDPLAARQKQAAHLDLFGSWVAGPVGRLLKTDLFEEANGDDQLLFELARRSESAVGVDVDQGVVASARQRSPAGGCISFLAADVRAMPFADNVMDVVLSNSTLDHFTRPEDFPVAVSELVRVLKPGGTLIISVDNVLNPLYWPLRWAGHLAAPFSLGYSPTPSALRQILRGAGATEVSSTGLIHNPRGVSTLLFLGLRRIFGRAADPAVRVLLNVFASLERLPTRRFTCCFWAVAVTKPHATQSATMNQPKVVR